MKFSSTVLALAACLPAAWAGKYKGFNIAAQNFDGSCKQESDWEKSFQEMKKVPGNFNQVRVYASSDCGTLANAVPAAKKTGIKIFAGVWAEDHAHYEAEKQALMSAVKEHGIGWLSAISVGSEDLYRGDTTAEVLAKQIHDVRGLISTVKGGKAIDVGHVDTYTAFVNESNAAVIKACDFVGMDAYPYFQGKDIKDAKHTFYKALKATRKAVTKHKKGTPIIVTESGWPVKGPSDKKAVSSVKNASRYWHGTLCGLFKKHSVFVYTLRDENAGPGDPDFGVLTKGFKPRFDLKC